MSRALPPLHHPLVWAVAIVAAVAVGVVARSADPLSSPVIPAEDPYTHMAYVREHLRDGELDPINDGGSLYPPGMHAYVAAAWVYSGVDLYDLFRYAPIALGAIGIVGIALLASRFEDRATALLAAVGVALAPEAVVRTTMLAPTALDLALLPFLLLALLHVCQGQLRWAAPAAVLALFLAFSHPWLFTILALGGAAFLALAIAMPWAEDRGARLSLRGAVVCSSILGAGVALSLSGCWGACGPGFRDVLPDHARTLSGMALVVFVCALAVGALALLVPRVVPGQVPRVPPLGRSRFVLALALAALLVVVTRPALEQGLPPNVSLVRMLGWPILAAAAVGFVLLPFLASPLANLAAALAIATYPFVIYNPLSSEFWSHRTAVYLGIALILLGAIAVARAAMATAQLLASRARLADRVRRPAVVLVPALLVSLALGSAWAATPDAREHRWYRLYEPCAFDAMREVAGIVDEDRSMLVVTGDWRPKLVLAALATGAPRIWFYAQPFTNAESRDQLLTDMQNAHRSVLFVVDPTLPAHMRDATGFLAEEPWEEVGAWTCPSASGPQLVAAYKVGAVPT